MCLFVFCCLFEFNFLGDKLINIFVLILLVVKLVCRFGFFVFLRLKVNCRIFVL